MRILVTGGAGYIGSHTCLELLRAGHEVVVVDNLSNSKAEALRRVQALAGRSLVFHRVDLLDRAALDAAFAGPKIDAVIHFAGLKAVGESVTIPLRYYHNNITGTLMLCESMRAHGVRNLVFSSSATVYGDPATVPITEDMPLSATNPYGRSKLMIEEILRDLYVSERDLEYRPAALLQPGGRSTPAAGSARIRTASPTTCCLSSPRSRSGSCRGCKCSATTTPPPTAPAFAIISTSSTWRWGIWLRWIGWPRTRAWSLTISAPAAATASWR